MSFDLVTTDYGRSALYALADSVRAAKAGEPLTPVTVVVPSNHVGVTARRLLATGVAGQLTPRGSGTVAITFVTPYRLAELLGAARLAATGRRPLSTPVLTAALRARLRAEPGVFGPVAHHPATEEALVAAYTDLADVSPTGLDRLAEASPRAADVVRLCRDARQHLTRRWYDESDLTAAARAALDGTPSAFGSGHLIVYLPQDLSQRSAALLRDVAARSPATVVAGLTGHEDADRGVTLSLRRLGAAPDSDGNPAAASSWPADASATRIVTTSDAEEEVRAAVQAVVDAARAGTPLDRMAVLFPTREPYARLVEEQFAAAGLQVNGSVGRTLAERAYGRTLLDLLALRDRRYRRRDLLGLLTAVPVRTTTGALAPTTEWERLSREAAVVGGRHQWDRRLADLAVQLERRAAEAEARAPGHGSTRDDDRQKVRASQFKRRADRAGNLRQVALGLIDEIEETAHHARPWRERVRWLRRVSGRLLGGETSREHWPDDERRAAERVDAALDRIAALDDVDDACTLDVFRRTLELELGADLGRTGRFGDGLLAGPLSFGVGLDLDLVVVLGAAEGALPAQLIDDSLLPDQERARAQGELPLRRHHAERQRRQLHAVLASSRAHVLLSPRGDLRAGGDRSASRWLIEISESAGAPVHWEETPSFAYRVTRNPFPATAQEYRLRTGPDEMHDPVVQAGTDLLRGRRSERFTRFDGNLSGIDLHSPAVEVVSATRLESWAICPHAYFMRHVLQVEPVDDPADLLWISPADKGALIHEALENFLREVLARPQHEAPLPGQPWSESDRALLRKIAAEVCASFESRGLVGRSLFWRRDRERILTLLDRFLDEDHLLRRNNNSTPVAAELAFGVPGATLPAIEMPLPDGRRLKFRGSADRVDLTQDGTLLVVDYKTGRSNGYRDLSEDNPDDHGTHLQLAVYGVAARHLEQLDTLPSPAETPVRAEYWFISDKEKLRTIGYQVSNEVLERVGGTLATIVDGISGGLFPARPTESASDPFVRCRYCNPDGLGVTDRRREWERKRHDPVLSAYAELAEPTGDEHPETTGDTSAKGTA